MPVLVHEYYLRSWMMFVDGENFTISAQRFCEGKGIKLDPSDYYCYCKDVYLWFSEKARHPIKVPQIGDLGSELQPRGIRAYYYTSVKGDYPKLNEVRNKLWQIGFHPEVFQKPSDDKRSKGIDIALAKDFLGNAYLNNYEAAILVAGDGDYIPLVKEIKRLGKRIYLLFFSETSLNSDLRLSSDAFFSIDDWFR